MFMIPIRREHGDYNDTGTSGAAGTALLVVDLIVDSLPPLIVLLATVLEYKDFINYKRKSSHFYLELEQQHPPRHQRSYNLMFHLTIDFSSQ